MEDNVGVGVVVDVDVVLEVDVAEHDAITVINTTIIPTIRQLIKNRICFLFKVIFPFSLNYNLSGMLHNDLVSAQNY